MGLLRLQIIHRWMAVDPNPDPIAHNTQANAKPLAIFDARFIDITNAVQAARAWQFVVLTAAPRRVVDLQFIALSWKAAFLVPSVKENAGVREALCPYLRIQFEIAEAMIAHRPSIKKMAPPAVGDQAAVPNRPRRAMLRSTPFVQ